MVVGFGFPCFTCRYSMTVVVYISTSLKHITLGERFACACSASPYPMKGMAKHITPGAVGCSLGA